MSAASYLPEWVKVDAGPLGASVGCDRCYGYTLIENGRTVGRVMELFNAFALAHATCTRSVSPALTTRAELSPARSSSG